MDALTAHGASAPSPTDSAGYGTVLINKAISITNEGGVEAAITEGQRLGILLDPAEAVDAALFRPLTADLEHRLLMGIEAGRDAGGQGTRERHKTERSAALRVYSTDTFADIDLRVDLHATAVEELRRVWTEYKQYEAYYRNRERNPSGAKGQEEFMKTLRAAEA